MNRIAACRRSFVLVAVLVVVSSAVLVATSLLFIVQGRAIDVAGLDDLAQNRSLAWSGVQAVMSRLNDQRDRMLTGEQPVLERQYTIYESPSRLGIIRVLPSSPGGADTCRSECGKLDLNSIDADALARTGMIDSTAAAAVLAQRDQNLHRAFQSISELLFVPGAAITPESLHGPIEDIKPRDQAQLERGDLAQRVLTRLNAQPVRGLTDVLTVFSVEPDVQRTGEPRININVPWSDDLARRVRRRFGPDAVAQLKKAFDDGVVFDSRQKIIQALVAANVAPENWTEILDAFTTDPGSALYGRLDINTAPYEALLGLPGITAEQAQQMVNLRENLAPQDRSTIAWPVVAQIIPPESFGQLADHITARSFCYRIRVAAGEVDAAQPEGSMTNPLIYEAVIDLSSPQPRVAYLRDISVLQAAAQIAVESSLRQPVQFDRNATPPAAPITAPVADDSETPATETADAAPADQPQNQDGDAEDTQPASSQAAGENTPAPARHRIGRWISGG